MTVLLCCVYTEHSALLFFSVFFPPFSFSQTVMLFRVLVICILPLPPSVSLCFPHELCRGVCLCASVLCGGVGGWVELALDSNYPCCHATCSWQGNMWKCFIKVQTYPY